MSNKEEKKVVPKLRFPEFANEPGWTNEPLAKRLIEHGFKSDGQSQVYSVSVHKGVVNQIEHLGRSFSAADTSKYNLVKPFDIIYTKSPTGDFPYGIVKQNLHHFNVIVSPLYGVFSPPNKHLGYLLHSYFESPVRTNNYLQSLVQKGAKNTLQISNERFLSKGIHLPNSEREQQKIADCLLSLDELVAAESQKLEALKVHKKGLMQQLFPGVGEMVPQLRFAGFEGEWEKKSLGELLQFKNGINASKELYGAGVKFINVLDILQNDFITYEKIIGSVNVSVDMVENFSVNYGDILFQRSSETQEEVGTANVYLDKEQTATFGGFVIRGKKVGDYNPVFLNKLLQTNPIRNSISSKSGGSTRFNIGQEVLSSTDILIPSICEQEKIAECLTSQDALITAHSQRIGALKLHKKGLMQQLFPSTNDVEP